jgi:hypothetical protein
MPTLSLGLFKLRRNQFCGSRFLHDLTDARFAVRRRAPLT